MRVDIAQFLVSGRVIVDTGHGHTRGLGMTHTERDGTLVWGTWLRSLCCYLRWSEWVVDVGQEQQQQH